MMISPRASSLNIGLQVRVIPIHKTPQVRSSLPVLETG
jgi:hypothetical protein